MILITTLLGAVLTGGFPMKKIAKDMIISDVLEVDIELAPFFFEIGMHCLGCPASRNETVEQACAVHNTDVDALLARLNGFLEEKAKA
jgi:hybrid cluster-associated redox disulfide protein